VVFGLLIQVIGKRRVCGSRKRSSQTKLIFQFANLAHGFLDDVRLLNASREKNRHGHPSVIFDVGIEATLRSSRAKPD
jgi:hypothetical protein